MLEECNFCGAPKPSKEVSLRCIDEHRWKILIRLPNSERMVVEEVEEWMAFYQIYEGATYMNNGKTFIIRVLDFEKREAEAHGPVKLDYYTSVRDLSNLETAAPLLAYPPLQLKKVDEALREKKERKLLIAPPHYGPATVIKSFLGYTKLKRISGKFLDSVDLQMPQVWMKTFAAWIAVPEEVQQMVKRSARGSAMPWEEHLRGGLHAASHALINVLPLFARCSANDAVTLCDYPAATRFRPRSIVIADRCKGGNGLSLQAYKVFGELLETALKMVRACNCTHFRGCPACVQMLSCSEYNVVLDKKSAMIILQGLQEGLSSSSSSSSFSFYSLPLLSSVDPAMRLADGNLPLLLRGQGLRPASSSFAKVRMINSQSKQVVTVEGKWREEEEAIEFLSPSMLPGAATIELALNGQQYVTSQLAVTYYLMPEVLDLVPDCCPSAGGELRVHLKNPHPHLLVRLRLPSKKELLLQIQQLEVSQDDPSRGSAVVKIPQVEEEGPVELAVSVDGSSFAAARNSVILFKPLQPSLPISSCSLAGGSTIAAVAPSIFPAAGWRVRVGAVEAPAKFRPSWGEVGACVTFETPAGGEAGVKEEEKKVEVAIAPDGKTWMACGQLTYFEPFTCTDLKPNKSGKEGASVNVTVAGSGFVESEHVFVKFQQDEAARVVRGEYVSDSAVSVTTPEGMEQGGWSVLVSLDGEHGDFVECPTAFTVV